MARSRKKGIDYYTMDVSLFADRKVRRLINAYGAGAIAVMMRVLCEAYKEEGYFIVADDDLYFDIAAELRLDESYVRNVISQCLKVKLFDNETYQRHGIIT